jgi:hypothetical protein
VQQLVLVIFSQNFKAAFSAEVGESQERKDTKLKK